MLAPSRLPPVKVCKRTTGRHFPGETRLSLKPRVIQASLISVQRAPVNPGCPSEEVPEEITAEQALPRSANGWGARMGAGEAGGGEPQVVGDSLVGLWMGLCSSAWSEPPGGLYACPLAERRRLGLHCVSPGCRQGGKLNSSHKSL